jgi:hypothetical protein
MNAMRARAMRINEKTRAAWFTRPMSGGAESGTESGGAGFDSGVGRIVVVSVEAGSESEVLSESESGEFGDSDSTSSVVVDSESEVLSSSESGELGDSESAVADSEVIGELDSASADTGALGSSEGTRGRTKDPLTHNCSPI